MEKCNIFSPLRSVNLFFLFSSVASCLPWADLEELCVRLLSVPSAPPGLMTQFALSTAAESAFLPAQVWEGKTPECQVHPGKSDRCQNSTDLATYRSTFVRASFFKKKKAPGWKERERWRETHKCNVGAVISAAMRACALPVQALPPQGLWWEIKTLWPVVFLKPVLSY